MKRASDLHPNDTVSVIRTSGDIEHDWFVVNPNIGGRALLQKKGTSVWDDITKAPKHETFDEWQEKIANA